MSDHLQRFGGIQRLLGEAQAEKLAQSHVAVVGVGGVGCWAAEALGRFGVGTLSLIDADDVCVTNVNRQLHALDSTVGQSKVAVMAQRLRDINPHAVVHAQAAFYLPGNSAELIQPGVDCVIDAIDSVRQKVHLLHHCVQLKVPVVCVGGAGGKQDPLRIQVDDLSRSHGDRLLRKVRSELRKQIPSDGKGRLGVRAVFSEETMQLPACDATANGGTSRRLDCNSGYGTSPAVIGVFGLLAAQEAVRLMTR